MSRPPRTEPAPSTPVHEIPFLFLFPAPAPSTLERSAQAQAPPRRPVDPKLNPSTPSSTPRPQAPSVNVSTPKLQASASTPKLQPPSSCEEMTASRKSAPASQKAAPRISQRCTRPRLARLHPASRKSAPRVPKGCTPRFGSLHPRSPQHKRVRMPTSPSCPRPLGGHREDDPERGIFKIQEAGTAGGRRVVRSPRHIPFATSRHRIASRPWLVIPVPDAPGKSSYTQLSRRREHPRGAAVPSSNTG
ncbi:hypothetical protein B0H15DRAFT_951723 [Mycena belliarum]|uniref:Uncharacterized protein n=1 Tax=Mycena belliarum TaxID=1033014 RepID=A0AAD6XM37_9AGAR|nr:hypothetical protein B0H15DRAFT_951723 [Mycena belliae]